MMAKDTETNMNLLTAIGIQVCARFQLDYDPNTRYYWRDENGELMDEHWLKKYLAKHKGE